MNLHSLLRKAKHGLEDVLPGGEEKHSHTHDGHECHEEEAHAEYGTNRYCSFAPQSSGHAKWHVDGASYFWAVSMALEEAREYVYILDWWLTPELYLRRPPARNERYRLDNMLKAAAERGVKVNVIVYKEVPQALTCNNISGLHTKHALEALHPNIKVFRYPDHHTSGSDVLSGFQGLHTSLQSFSLKTFDLAKASQDVVKGLYGTADDITLFWSHHEKLCLIDGKIAFMGGLDMCHPIADAHPGNIDDVIFPGQDYNNARVYDFEDVQKWENNKLDRTKSSRMGWSDISISLSGPIVDSLAIHFTQRWNFIFKQKYTNRDVGKYALLSPPGAHRGPESHLLDENELSFGGLQNRFTRHVHRFLGEEEEPRHGPHRDSEGAHIQLTRSSCKWSLGITTEHSIANAYIESIKNARHFVYIENQFFITATSDKQRPVINKIGRAIVDRIIRAHQNGEDFHLVVMMPAVPAFAGDLKSEGALGTRAIMEFQYASINRGGSSIIESLRNAGIQDPHQYINFYNLRNYDRINANAVMGHVERESGVPYEEARRDYDDRYEGHHNRQRRHDDNSQYHRYQEASNRVSDETWDSISACYMDNGPDLRNLPWAGRREDEFNAFVSEQLYIHSKVLIADDQLVICGSANLNDRSQRGDHDSEIAVVIEDPTPVSSTMNGRPYTASAFAASLRRQLFRKHLGLLPHQRPDRPDRNWTPVTHDVVNDYDWGSHADRLVADPLSRDFLRLWQTTARRNTDIFRRAFHCVPDDRMRTWEEYDTQFSKHFVMPGTSEEDAKKGYQEGKVDYGHVVPQEFPGGLEELKDWLGGVRGTLVEMPLQFLIDVPDLAEDGLTLNSLTDDLYT
ncbi:uncharacterized protein C8A04DRAFT_13240 [Dichotomopilus funicola]|uniref:Phospholipase n=1 Tax=Dichotomopilus funicola TaxID=1934379 RepID=A0AAN6V046_9PEZI|nr:hypothetical protein C8A04DRAFT_13240 [Dichotomopilus funicola]